MHRAPRRGCRSTSHGRTRGWTTARPGSARMKNMPACASVDAYLAAATPAARRALQRIRRTIHAAAKDVEERFSYGIPSFRLHGKTLMWFAAFKDHCSLFPTAAVIAQYKTQLKRFDTSKGTIRFDPRTAPSAALVAKLVKARVGMIRRTAAKKAVKKAVR